MDESMCGFCGAPTFFMGVLGNLAHYRCGFCGAQWSRSVDEDWDGAPSPDGEIYEPGAPCDQGVGEVTDGRTEVEASAD